MLFYELVHKQAFDHQLLSLPRTAIPQVLEKVELLRVAPAPDAKTKKRLHGYKGSVYRIRAGNYRILYTYDEGAGWVCLLGVDDRKDVYKGDKLAADGVTADLSGVPEPADILQTTAPTWKPTPLVAVEPPAPAAEGALPIGDGQLDAVLDVPIARTAAAPTPEPLPHTLHQGLLRQLRVPDAHIPALLRCRTIDDLIAAPVPEAVRNLVFDATVAPNLDLVLTQPSYAVDSVEDFRRWVDGDLLTFLLKLDPEQEKFVDWAVSGSGPALVKGSPGTGKSIIAIYRARSLIAALRKTGVSQPRILFTAYTNSLVESSRQLLRRLLGPDAPLVHVSTADKLAWETVANAGRLPRTILDEGRARAELMLARQVLQAGTDEDRQLFGTITGLNLDYLLDEIDGVIVAREHRDLASYLEEDRAGRRVRLTATQRRAIWRLHEAREAMSTRTGFLTWSQFRRRAVELVRAGYGPAPFDGVLVDEAQDLEPTAHRMLVTLCRSTDRLFLTADPNQSIYGSGFRWKDVHTDLRFRGRTGVLKRNHRSTQEIGQAATGYLAGAELEADDEAIDYARSGPRPTLWLVRSRDAETEAIAGFFREATRELRIGLGGCAVLVPTWKAGNDVAARLNGLGLAAAFMPQKAINLEQPVIKVIPMKSAKGLEFPIVAVAGLIGGYPPALPKGAAADEEDEALRLVRRTLYVAMTRAMHALLVVAPDGATSPCFAGFDPDAWRITDRTRGVPPDGWVEDVELRELPLPPLVARIESSPTGDETPA